jgi:hypothetical protein
MFIYLFIYNNTFTWLHRTTALSAACGVVHAKYRFGVTAVTLCD